MLRSIWAMRSVQIASTRSEVNTTLNLLKIQTVLSIPNRRVVRTV